MQMGRFGPTQQVTHPTQQEHFGFWVGLDPPQHLTQMSQCSTQNQAPPHIGKEEETG
jgi:hypothetical protein